MMKHFTEDEYSMVSLFVLSQGKVLASNANKKEISISI